MIVLGVLAPRSRARRTQRRSRQTTAPAGSAGQDGRATCSPCGRRASMLPPRRTALADDRRAPAVGRCACHSSPFSDAPCTQRSGRSSAATRRARRRRCRCGRSPSARTLQSTASPRRCVQGISGRVSVGARRSAPQVGADPRPAASRRGRAPPRLLRRDGAGQRRTASRTADAVARAVATALRRAASLTATEVVPLTCATQWMVPTHERAAADVDAAGCGSVRARGEESIRPQRAARRRTRSASTTSRTQAPAGDTCQQQAAGSVVDQQRAARVAEARALAGRARRRRRSSWRPRTGSRAGRAGGVVARA